VEVTLAEVRAAADPAAQVDVGRAASLLSAGTFTAQSAYREGDDAEGAAWGQATTDLVRLMAARNQIPGDDAAIRQLALARLGLAHPGTAGWVDVDRVVRDTARALPSNVDKTAKKAATWRDLKAPEIYELRKTKTLLAGLAQLRGHSSAAEEIMLAWAAVLPLLP